MKHDRHVTSWYVKLLALLLFLGAIVLIIFLINNAQTNTDVVSGLQIENENEIKAESQTETVSPFEKINEDTFLEDLYARNPNLNQGDIEEIAEGEFGKLTEGLDNSLFSLYDLIEDIPYEDLHDFEANIIMNLNLPGVFKADNCLILRSSERFREFCTTTSFDERGTEYFLIGTYKGRLVIMGQYYDQGNFILIDLSTLEETFSLDNVMISPNEKRVATSGQDGGGDNNPFISDIFFIDRSVGNFKYNYSELEKFYWLSDDIFFISFQANKETYYLRVDLSSHVSSHISNKRLHCLDINEDIGCGILPENR